MYRSTLPHPHHHRSAYLYAALALTATMLVVITIAITRENLAAPVTDIPVIAPPAVILPDTSPKVLDLYAGAKLNLVTGQLIYPAAQLKPQPRTIELGAGYVLNISGRGDGQISAPTRPSTAYQKLDLGAGYTLEVSGNYGEVSAPALSAAPQPYVLQTVDIGSGYSLVLTNAGGAIMAPAVLNQKAIQKTDLGGGYWLETWQDGGQIVGKR